LNDTLTASQKRFFSAQALARTYADSIAAMRLRYQELKLRESGANEENRKLAMELQTSSKAHADSVATFLLRYRSAITDRDVAESKLRDCKHQLDSLNGVKATLSSASVRLSDLNKSLRGAWEKFRDEILVKIDASKPEVLELAFLSLEEVYHEEASSEMSYRADKLEADELDIMVPNTFERRVGFENREFIEIQTVMSFMMPAGALGMTSTSMLLDKNSGVMVTWADLILEGHQEAVSGLFAKKARALLPEITQCLQGDSEMANNLIADFSNLSAISFGEGSLQYSINADDDGVSPCGWDVSVSLNELRAHLSPRIFK
ncbi:MAG: hypothetical protein ACKOW8_06485, partial [Flavobacteriales bacterium]